MVGSVEVCNIVSSPINTFSLPKMCHCSQSVGIILVVI